MFLSNAGKIRQIKILFYSAEGTLFLIVPVIRTPGCEFLTERGRSRFNLTRKLFGRMVLRMSHP